MCTEEVLGDIVDFNTLQTHQGRVEQHFFPSQHIFVRSRAQAEDDDDSLVCRSQVHANRFHVKPKRIGHAIPFLPRPNRPTKLKKQV